MEFSRIIFHFKEKGLDRGHPSRKTMKERRNTMQLVILAHEVKENAGSLHHKEEKIL